MGHAFNMLGMLHPDLKSCVRGRVHGIGLGVDKAYLHHMCTLWWHSAQDGAVVMCMPRCARHCGTREPRGAGPGPCAPQRLHACMRGLLLLLAGTRAQVRVRACRAAGCPRSAGRSWACCPRCACWPLTFCGRSCARWGLGHGSRDCDSCWVKLAGRSATTKPIPCLHARRALSTCTCLLHQPDPPFPAPLRVDMQARHFGIVSHFSQPWNMLDMASIGLVMASIIQHLSCIGATPTVLRALAGIQVGPLHAHMHASKQASIPW